MLHLHGGLARVGSVRGKDRMRLKSVGVCKNLLRGCAQDLHIGHDLRKKVVRDVGLQGGAAPQIGAHDIFHRALGDFLDGRLLLFIGLHDNLRQIFQMEAEHSGIYADQPQDEDQKKREYLRLQAAYFDSLYDFHIKTPQVFHLYCSSHKFLNFGRAILPCFAGAPLRGERNGN